jgi:predicted lipoprotein with Yx(FWY)xxD motif
MSVYRWLALMAAPVAALALTTPAVASTATPAASHAKASGTKIIVADTPFGWSLAVGSGPYKNYALYYISSDNPPSYGCTTVVVSLPGAPPGATCAGPSNDQNAEWPAITTNNGKPVAGPGVSQALLGRVYRKHVGWQVTYAGHPLYLFDHGPGQVTGEGWFEAGPLLPPWHGIWWLISADGTPVPWAGTLTTTKIGGKTLLAETYQTVAGFVNFPVYTFSGDQPYSWAACTVNPTCQRAWPPVLTSGLPALSGLYGYGAGHLRVGDVLQVTWHGHPLYLFSKEKLAPASNGAPVPAGNGNGIKAFGGTFSLVVNP